MKIKNKTCLICDRETNSHIYICDDCYSLIVPKKERVVRDMDYVDEVYACFYYNEILSDIILKYKFADRRYFSKLLGELLIEKILKESLHKKADMLISVPISKNTLKKRGFNQVELLEDEIVSNLMIKSSKKNLIKIKETKEQARLSEAERKKNLEDSFEVLNRQSIKNKKIILLDDLITTGATLDNCGKVLKESGASYIYGLTVGTSD